MTVITGSAQIEMARLLTLRSALRIEIKTGLKHSSGQIGNLIRAAIGSKTRLKKKLLVEFNEYIDRKGAAFFFVSLAKGSNASR